MWFNRAFAQGLIKYVSFWRQAFVPKKIHPSFSFLQCNFRMIQDDDFRGGGGGGWSQVDPYFQPTYVKKFKPVLVQNNTTKNYHLFKVVENRMQQCCAAHIVHSCQQYFSALLSLNQPVIRCNNAEQYC